MSFNESVSFLPHKFFYFFCQFDYKFWQKIWKMVWRLSWLQFHFRFWIRNTVLTFYSVCLFFKGDFLKQPESVAGKKHLSLYNPPIIPWDCCDIHYQYTSKQQLGTLLLTKEGGGDHQCCLKKLTKLLWLHPNILKNCLLSLSNF